MNTYVYQAIFVRYLLVRALKNFFETFLCSFHLPTEFTIQISELRDRYGLVKQFRKQHKNVTNRFYSEQSHFFACFVDSQLLGEPIDSSLDCVPEWLKDWYWFQTLCGLQFLFRKILLPKLCMLSPPVNCDICSLGLRSLGPLGC